MRKCIIVLISSVQSLSCVPLFAIPQTAARQASLSITNSWSVLKLMSTTSVMPSNHLILCCPLLLLPSIFPSIRVFSNESALCIWWPKYWSFSFNISPSKEHSGLSLYKWKKKKEREEERFSNLFQHNSKQTSKWQNLDVRCHLMSDSEVYDLYTVPGSGKNVLKHPSIVNHHSVQI